MQVIRTAITFHMSPSPRSLTSIDFHYDFFDDEYRPLVDWEDPNSPLSEVHEFLNELWYDTDQIDLANGFTMRRLMGDARQIIFFDLDICGGKTFLTPEHTKEFVKYLVNAGVGGCVKGDSEAEVDDDEYIV